MEGKTCAEVDSCSTAAEVIAECSAHPQQNRSRSNRLRRARRGASRGQPINMRSSSRLPLQCHLPPKHSKSTTGNIKLIIQRKRKFHIHEIIHASSNSRPPMCTTAACRKNQHPLSIEIELNQISTPELNTIIINTSQQASLSFVDNQSGPAVI